MGDDVDLEQMWSYMRGALAVFGVMFLATVWVVWRAIRTERSSRQLLERVVELLTEIRDGQKQCGDNDETRSPKSE